MSFAGGGLIFLWSVTSTSTVTATVTATATASAATATEPDGYMGHGGLGMWNSQSQWPKRGGQWRRWKRAA